MPRSEPFSSSISNKTERVVRLKEVFTKLYFVIVSIVGSGLVIKQLSTNLIYFLLSIFLQSENIDLQYQINIKSVVLGLISTLFCIRLIAYFVSSTLISFSEFK